MKSISRQLIKKIEVNYSLRNLEFVKKIDAGYLSHNFILSLGKNKYFLKQHRHKDLKRINEIYKIEDFFITKGVSVISPILTKSKHKYFKDKNHYYSLLPFINAKKFSRETSTAKSLVSSAKLLAKIHLQSKNKLPKLTKETQNPWTKQNFLKIAKEVRIELEKKKNFSEIDKIASDILELKSRIVSDNNFKFKDLSRGKDHLLHGDFHWNNLFFNNKGEVQYLFDWEKTEIYSRYFELIRAIDLMCFGTTYNKNRYDKAGLFLKTYNNFYPLSKKLFKDEVFHFYLRKVHSLWLHKEHYLANNNRIDPLFIKDLKKTKFYHSHWKEMADRLLSYLND